MSTLAFVEGVNIAGSSSGIGRATKKVRRRPKIPLDTEDPMVDENGRKVQSSVQKYIERNMVKTIIVKLLGRRIGFNVLLNKVSSMWSLRNPIQVMDLENDYYLVRFQDEEDYNKVLIGGPWVIFGQYLTVCLWLPFFFTMKDELDAQVVCQKIGSVTKIDKQANAVRRGRFACLAVSVDLRKSLVSKVKINERIQCVEYESLLNVCFKRGLYGHNTDWCMANNEPLPDCQANWGAHTNIVEGLQKQVEKEAFEPWMLIEHWHRGKGCSMGLVKTDLWYNCRPFKIHGA
ncbi:hypothetical protein GOBAR_AA35285 [Gossypium barbadense]|uniref:DUF4283 domain-containing protein n=1 Tax=Gossypium barbadense TaxID=3634 RepID=A0A2P5W2W9_GOSBA|nr:hypothetical protein GOBAR_AA35285 [Gossypium barbadense]